MDKTISIIAASVFGVGISAGVGLYVGNTYNAKSNVPAPTPVVTQAPAPVVVKDPMNDEVTIITTSKKTFTALRKNVSCRTETGHYFSNGEYYENRYCSAHGVITDLTGKKTHYSENDELCFAKDGEYGNWTNSWGINSMACSAAIKLGAS